MGSFFARASWGTLPSWGCHCPVFLACPLSTIVEDSPAHERSPLRFAAPWIVRRGTCIARSRVMGLLARLGLLARVDSPSPTLGRAQEHPGVALAGLRPGGQSAVEPASTVTLAGQVDGWLFAGCPAGPSPCAAGHAGLPEHVAQLAQSGFALEGGWGWGWHGRIMRSRG